MLCRKCKKNKKETDFVYLDKKKKIKHTVCKRCKNIHYQKKWYLKHRKEHIARTRERRKKYIAEMREYLVEYYKSHPCEHCGITNPVVLEFHHKSADEKNMEIGRILDGSRTVTFLKKELEKCQVLCANCHRIETAKEQNWFKGRLQ